MEQEKEVRFYITENQVKEIIKNTTPLKERMEMLDITCGYEGFNSYSKYGFICRVRQKGEEKTLEVKNYTNKNECIEQSIKLEKVVDGINYLKLIGMTPYLYLKRFREVRTFGNLKIFIDEFDILGNFVEIEYQNSDNAKEEVEKFINLIKIDGRKQDMYGNIVKEKIEKDKNFKKVFEETLEKILSNS